MTALALVAPNAALAFPTDAAVLQGLDKVTARISTFTVPLNQEARFGGLSIILRHCDRAPPEEPPEAKAFLEIVELRAGEPAKRLFSGWMFASSPALSALQHPVYDIWVKECVTIAPASEAPGAEDPQAE
ncbi:MAG: DUF2155 domain-containing protein [Alphaproteobacteria bacterium]|nr:DUF2155 domain-containing protein [Alphaproteobacteria bacterium]